MGVCIKLATRSLRKNKGRTLITLMGIVLSVLMVCTIFTLLNSMLDSAIDSIIEKDGNWHIAVYNTTAEQIADLEAAEGVLSTQMISIDENDVFRITLKNPDEVYEFASRYLSETTEFVISSLAMFLIMFLTSLYGLWKIKNGDIIADVRNDFV